MCVISDTSPHAFFFRSARTVVQSLEDHLSLTIKRRRRLDENRVRLRRSGYVKNPIRREGLQGAVRHVWISCMASRVESSVTITTPHAFESLGASVPKTLEAAAFALTTRGDAAITLDTTTLAGPALKRHRSQWPSAYLPGRKMMNRKMVPLLVRDERCGRDVAFY